MKALSEAPSVTIGRTKFDIPGLMQNGKGDVNDNMAILLVRKLCP